MPTVSFYTWYSLVLVLSYLTVMKCTKFTLLLAVLTVSASTADISAQSALRPTSLQLKGRGNGFKNNVNAKSPPIVGSTQVGASNLVPQGKALEMFKLAGLFFLWYGFNAGYNVFNAFMKKDFQFPLTSAALQLLVGMIYAVPLWLLKLRKIPNISKDDFLKLLPIGTFELVMISIMIIHFLP